MHKEFNLGTPNKWDNVFKNGTSKICGRQPLKNFTSTILEFFVSNNPGERLFFVSEAIQFFKAFTILSPTGSLPKFCF